jgi:hypothetical protein
MNLLDLYENREPYQQAIDRLEQARIAHLKEKMDDYAKHKNAKGFKAAKKELDSYYKIKDECMGYGSLGEADEVPVGRMQPGTPEYAAARNRSVKYAGKDLVTPQQRVAGATPPSNTVVGKAKSTFSSFVDWLAGRDDTGPTYESTVKEQTSAASPVTAAKYAYEQMRKAFEDNVDIATIRWMNTAEPVTMSRNQLFHTLAKLKSMSRQNRNQFALQTLADRQKFYLWLGGQKKITPRPALKQPKDPLQPELPLNKPTPGIPVQERAQKKNSEETKFGDVETANTVRKIRAKYPAARSDVEALAKDEIANQEKTNKTISDLEAVNARQDAALKQARALDSQQGSDLDNVEQQIDQLSQRLQLIKTAKPVAGRPTSSAPKITKQPAKTEPKTTEPISVPVAAVNPGLEKKIDDLNKQIKNLPKGADPQVENDLQAKLARAEELLKNYSQRIAAAQAQKQSDVLSPSDQAQQQLAKATQKSASQPQTIPRSLNLKTRAPSGDRDLKPTFKAKTKTKTTPLKATPVPEPEDEFDLLNIDESANKLHAGDPIVVTAPNEFEGKTGEIYDFAPSGTFVIVDLYNHGKHSMHLSDVAYNDYADQEEADDWYDEEVNESNMSELDAMRQDYERLSPEQFNSMYHITKKNFFQKYRTLLKPAAQQDVPVEEGYVPLGKYSPTYVCLAGKPVKKFDYYEDAERFHNNWKQKLYREGNKEKADKITLLDATDETTNPAQQAAIAIAMKKAGKKPKHVDEAINEKGALKSAQATAKFIIHNLDDRHALKIYAPNTWSPTKFYQGATAAMRGASFDEIVDIVLQRDQSLAEDTGSWIVYDPETKQIKKRFKTHTAGKSYAKVHGLEFASSEYYFDNVKEKSVAEAETDFSKRRQRERDVGAGRPVKPLPKNPQTDYARKRAKDKRDMELGEMHEPQKYIVTINGKATSPLYADMADRLYTAAKRAQPNARIEKTPAPTAQRQKGIDRVKAGYGDEDALELHETRNIQNRQDFERAIDSIDRQLTAETNPVNIQILRIERKDLENRARHEGWLPIPKQTVREESSTSSEAVEIALIRRVLVAHTDLIMEFGLDKVTQAIEEVAYNVGDVDEIGTSDVSGWINQVKQILGVPEELGEKWSQKYKRSINCASPKGFSQRAHCAGKKK